MTYDGRALIASRWVLSSQIGSLKLKAASLPWRWLFGCRLAGGTVPSQFINQSVVRPPLRRLIQLPPQALLMDGLIAAPAQRASKSVLLVLVLAHHLANSEVISIQNAESLLCMNL